MEKQRGYQYGKLGSRSLPFLLFCLLNFSTTPIKTEKRLPINLLQWRFKGKIKLNKETSRFVIGIACLSLRTASNLWWVYLIDCTWPLATYSTMMVFQLKLFERCPPPFFFIIHRIIPGPSATFTQSLFRNSMCSHWWLLWRKANFQALGSSPREPVQ